LDSREKVFSILGLRPRDRDGTIERTPNFHTDPPKEARPRGQSPGAGARARKSGGSGTHRRAETKGPKAYPRPPKSSPAGRVRRSLLAPPFPKRAVRRQVRQVIQTQNGQMLKLQIRQILAALVSLVLSETFRQKRLPRFDHFAPLSFECPFARSVSLTDSTRPNIAQRAEKSRGVLGFPRESFFDFGVALAGPIWYNRADP